MGEKRKDIRDFLLVIFAGIFTAFIVVFWMIKEDPSEKQLKVSEALLSPETIEQMSNRAVTSNPSLSAQYLVESIDFSHFDPLKGKWEMTQVDIGPYQQIYRLLEGDVGNRKANPEVESQFDQGNISTLAIYVKVHKPYQTGAASSLFQQIQILPSGEWYRVQIHADSDKPQWFYYRHPQILDELLQIIKGQS